MKDIKTRDGGQYSPVKIFFRLLFESKRYLTLYIFVCLVTVALSSVSVVEADGLKKMINGISQNSRELLKSGIIQIFAAVLLIAPAIRTVKTAVGARLKTYSSKIMQTKATRHVMRIELSKLNELHSGDIVSRVIDDCSEAQAGINSTTIDLIYNVFRIFFAIMYLSLSSIRLTAGVIAIVIIVPFFVRPLAKGVRNAKDNEKKVMAEIDALIMDSYHGSEIIRAFNLSGTIQKNYIQTFNRLAEWTKRSKIIAHISNWGLSLTDTLTFLFVLIYGGFLVIDGELVLGDVVAFIPLLDVIAYPVGRISKMWIDLQEALASGNRVYNLLDLPAEQINCEDAGFEMGDIELRNVSFSYKQGLQVLKNVSFTAKRGETTAIVGKSGSGKTTIINLLLKLYKPDGGKVLCGGSEICNIDNHKWRSKIAYVTQDPGIFTGTVLENILLGDLNADFKQVEEAAKRANIHDFIASLPKGYETNISERGVNISGGERQRIAIARAILKNPQILILDEPTSSLDSENEKAVQSALEELMRGKTTIVIAHRLSTIRNADKIVIVDSGDVIDEGTHSELLQKCSVYSELYNIEDKAI